jgi:hypothetical protein
MTDYSNTDLSIKDQMRVQFGSTRRKKSGSVKGRKEAEKAAMRSPTDGRLTHRGPTAQINVEVQEHWKAWLAEAKQIHTMKIVEIIERGLELVRAELESQGMGNGRA